MLLIIKVKDTDNIIGLKEDIAARLEGVADIERIDVCDDRKGQNEQSCFNKHSAEVVRTYRIRQKDH